MFICKEHDTIMWVFYWSIVDLQFYTSIVIHSLYFLILNQSILKISPGCSLEGLMLKLKLHTLATWCKQLTHLKRPWCWERLKVGGEGVDRGWDGWMASPNSMNMSLGRFRELDDGQGDLACCSTRGHKESDTTERLNWTESPTPYCPSPFRILYFEK